MWVHPIREIIGKRQAYKVFFMKSVGTFTYYERDIKKEMDLNISRIMNISLGSYYISVLREEPWIHLHIMREILRKRPS